MVLKGSKLEETANIFSTPFSLRFLFLKEVFLASDTSVGFLRYV